MTLKIEPESDITVTLGMHHSPALSKRLKRYLVIAVVALLTMAAVIIWKKVGERTVPQYKTEYVRRGDLTVIVTATGTLQPTNTVSVGSELSGMIKTVEVNYNDRVNIGQVLARLDTSKLQAQLTQSKAALESAKAKAMQAQATLVETRTKLGQLQKLRELTDGKAPSQVEIDTAEAAFERAKADAASATASVAQAKATVQANETDLFKSIIRSPINGVVLTRNIDPGQTVAATLQAPVLFTLAEDLTQMELRVNVDEADIGKVREGQHAVFSVSAYPNRTFEARITQTRYASTTTSGVVTYETVLKVSNSDLSLRPGMTATAGITVNTIENTVLTPSAALRFTPPTQEDSRPSTGLVGTLLPRPPSPSTKPQEDIDIGNTHQRVWTMRDGRLSAIPVTIGSTDGRVTEIVSGDIQPGMALVVDIVGTDK